MGEEMRRDYLFASKCPKAMVTERVKIASPKMRIPSGNRNTSNPVVFILFISNIEIISKKNAMTPISMTKVAVLTIFPILVFYINQIELFKNIAKKLYPVKTEFLLMSNDTP
jgi:hypothetical protein